MTNDLIVFSYKIYTFTSYTVQGPIHAQARSEKLLVHIKYNHVSFYKVAG